MPSTTSSSLRIVPSCLTNGSSELTEPDLRRLHDVAEIAYADRCAVLHFDHGGADVVGSLHQADGAHVQRLLAALDEPTARVDVVVDERLLDLRTGTARSDTSLLGSSCT